MGSLFATARTAARRTWVRRSQGLLPLLAILGCGDGAGSSGDNGAVPGEQAQAFRGKRRVSEKTGAYFADVDASGTGCPAGTWDAAIAADGETFTLRFSAYEISVVPGQARNTKDCQIDIALGSTEGLSYSVASFFYQGYVSLENEGMRARQSARYGFRRAGERSLDRTDIAGPIDDSYTHSGELEPEGGAWSSCERSDALRIQTRLVIRNDRQSSGSGYMNMSAIDGSVQLRWKLRFRRCRLQQPT
jgi:Domain of unknown function (DUF4360)